jgi:Helix-turn-helix domain
VSRSGQRRYVTAEVIGVFPQEVKRHLLDIFGVSAYPAGDMARRPPSPPPGATLQHLLDASGLSLGEVCERSDIADRSLWAMRQGQVARPRATTVSKLARVLGLDVDVVRKAIEASHRAAAK